MPSWKEYYCFSCHQLRQCLTGVLPTHCKNCNSMRITIDEPGSERLTKLRFGDSMPNALISVIAINLKTDLKVN